MFLKLINNLIFGRKSMEAAKPTKYTDDMVAEMVAAYQANPNRETVDFFANKFEFSARSIIAKLSREGVYIAQQRVTKTGAPVVRKAEIVEKIQNAVGRELPTLEKASKQDLEALLEAVMGN
jgi:hypothetical protein